jgi:hypothetical protein
MTTPDQLSIPITTLILEIEHLMEDAADTATRAGALVRQVCKAFGTSEAFTLAEQIQRAHELSNSARIWATRLSNELAELQQERDKEPHS